MSGTLGIAPIREVGVVGVLRLARSVRVHFGVVHRRGGLSVPAAVPIAIVVTTVVVWVTVAAATGWVTA
ncbi:MAG: hypothetical protein LH645_02050 [Actinomycetia bacterium]|nr:hypothetical protein [Actinomycetes bacterium]